MLTDRPTPPGAARLITADTDHRETGLGPGGFETCSADGTQVIRGVPVAPAAPGRDIADAAARITHLGLIVCPEHAPIAVGLARQ